MSDATHEDIMKVLTQPTVDATVAGRVLGISKASVYKACEAGQLQSFRLCTALRLPTLPLRQLLQLPTAPTQEAA